MAVIDNRHWNGVHPTQKPETLLKSLSFCLHSILQWQHIPVAEICKNGVAVNNEGTARQISMHIFFNF